MALIGPAVLICAGRGSGSTLSRALQGLRVVHLNHDFYNMSWGETYLPAADAALYAPVMSIATVPFITMPSACVARCICTRAGHDSASASATCSSGIARSCWGVGVGVSYGPWLSTNTPIFGGTKH